ncbi:double zinc ribbon domain-containing protein [Ferrovibrio xuzhouensis]|uniref:Double zinc ribbon domain-containing protein n=1 Tax=Ferrovibrio xuzhouensis TaxID=1576914 RepID=A0ABV7VJR5_9PROT
MRASDTLPAWAGALRLGLRSAADLLLPPQCMLCSTEVDAPGRLCAACWPRLRFVAEPCCPTCGTPYAIPVPAGLVCGACLQEAPAYGRARAAFVYADGGRDLVLRFKRGDRTDLAPGLARLMHAAGRALLADCDLILPVPLHRGRLWRRRYNQSALLATALGRLAGRPVRLDLLERRRATPSLGRHGRIERRRILSGAIGISAAGRGDVRGRRILLVDDVLTSGATASACCRVLLRAGAAGVDVLTLARVVRAEQGTI